MFDEELSCYKIVCKFYLESDFKIKIGIVLFFLFIIFGHRTVVYIIMIHLKIKLIFIRKYHNFL